MLGNWSLTALLAAAALGAACSAPEPEAPPATQPPAAKTGLQNGSFKADLNGFAIHFEVHGQGPVLMTVPNSWGLSLGGLRALYEPLEEKLTLVYFDPRGMGESAPVKQDADMSMAAVRADFDALRRHLGLETVNAIGWSNGAMNLILLASEKPDTLSSAIFLHGAASFTEEDGARLAEQHPELFERYAAFQKEIAAASLSDEDRDARQREFWLDEYFPLLFADPEAGKLRLQKMYEGVKLSWAHARYAEQELPTFDFRDRLPAVQARALVIAGANDLLAPERVKQLHDGIVGSEFVVFENSGHFAPVEEPEAFKTRVCAFLDVR